MGNKRKNLLSFAAAAIISIIITAVLYAGTTVPDEVLMKNPAYTKHKKSLVNFPHKKHVEDYAKESCGQCHHDDKGKPLSLKMGDDVQNCIECHKIPSERPKGKDAPKLTKKQRLEYHAEAIHYSCRGCHKKANKKSGTKAAPTTCKGCHPKKAK